MAELCGCDRFTNDPGALAIDPIHALSCQRTRGREITERHDYVVDVTATALRAYGVRVHVEASGHDDKTNKRPDIFAVINRVPRLSTLAWYIHRRSRIVRNCRARLQISTARRRSPSIIRWRKNVMVRYYRSSSRAAVVSVMVNTRSTF
jgi:hypothetical protein